jgi:hypothetical protein
MSYEDKISKVKEIIDSHNKLAKKPIDFEKFITNLQEAGGTTDEALKCCTWEDLEKFSLPTLLAKQAATAFRSKEESPRRIITEARAQVMTPRELLEHYDPRNHDNFVGKRLIELAKSNPCLVYNDDGTVNQDASAKLLDELRDGYPARETFMVNERPYKVYQIGQRPDQFAFENPLYPGTLLRPDETCDHTNRSWVGVPEVVRVLLYLAVKETKEIRVNSIDVSHAVLDFATDEKKVRNRYTKASLMYDDLKTRGSLPTLRLSRSTRSVNDPFYNAHKRY